MLLPYTTLTYYGEGAAATVQNDSIGVVTADIKATAKATGQSFGVASMPFAHVTGLKNSPCTITGLGLMTNALPKARARPTATIKVNSLSQDDVSGALQTMTVEGNITFAQLMRAVLAFVANDATGLNGTSPAFKSLDGTKTRIAASNIDGNRTITTLDLS